ncbi:MAG: hypothetical protein E7262_10795 [Lachnospiraceae bacterium]|nr:hypothetical protein [Lachnospiraceae bacterium]
MKTSGRGMLYKNIKASMLLILVFVMCFNKNSNVVANAAEDVITTHIWATTYDKNNHWEYCTLCGEIRNKVAHTFVDHWLYGSESCNDTNFSTRICDCGYNYVYKKPHADTSQWKPIVSRLLHYNNCVSCGRWRKSEQCYNYDAQGKKQSLSCKNPGTCVVCGSQPTEGTHFLTKPGKCKYCGLQIFTMSNYTVEYAPDNSYAIVSFTWTPAMEGVTLTGSISAYQTVNIYSSVSWSNLKRDDGSVTYTGKYVFNKNRQQKSELHVADCQNVAKLNGVSLYADSSFYKIPLWQDREAPTIDSIEQTDQLMHNSWATIKQLDISGSDATTSIVTISIIDKETNEIIVDAAKVPVINGKYNYVCTPPLEGPAGGRPYILKVADELGNVLKHEFMIYKTDSKPPVLESGNEFTQWSQTKNITLDIGDYGSAGVQTSLGNQYSYINAPYVSDNMYRLAYKFKDDNYGVTTYDLYMRDGLGNATKTTFTVGRVDNTKPTVTDIKVDETDSSATLTVSAHDFNDILQAEGSGIEGYALTNDVEIPPANKWQTSNVITTTMTGRLYLWVKDVAGNIADVKKIDISESFIVQLKRDDLVIYDGARNAVDKIMPDNIVNVMTGTNGILSRIILDGKVKYPVNRLIESNIPHIVNKDITYSEQVKDYKKLGGANTDGKYINYKLVDNKVEMTNSSLGVKKYYGLNSYTANKSNSNGRIIGNIIYVYLFMGLAFASTVIILISERRKALSRLDSKDE